MVCLCVRSIPYTSGILVKIMHLKLMNHNISNVGNPTLKSIEKLVRKDN